MARFRRPVRVQRLVETSEDIEGIRDTGFLFETPRTQIGEEGAGHRCRSPAGRSRRGGEAPSIGCDRRFGALLSVPEFRQVEFQ